VAHTTATWLEALVRGQRRPRLAEERAAVAKVTAAEVQALARDVLRPETLRWVVSGAPRAAADAVQSARLGPLAPYTPRD
jgi:predicted Zn-dependent peptidase